MRAPKLSKKERAEFLIAIVDIESLELIGIVRRWYKATVAWTPGTHFGTGETQAEAVRNAMQRALRTRKKFEAIGKEYGPL